MPSSSLHSVPSLSDPSIPSSARSSPSTSIHQRRLARVPDANGDYHHRTRPCPAPFLPCSFPFLLSLSLLRAALPLLSSSSQGTDLPYPPIVLVATLRIHAGTASSATPFLAGAPNQACLRLSLSFPFSPSVALSHGISPSCSSCCRSSRGRRVASSSSSRAPRSLFCTWIRITPAAPPRVPALLLLPGEGHTSASFGSSERASRMPFRPLLHPASNEETRASPYPLTARPPLLRHRSRDERRPCPGPAASPSREAQRARSTQI